MSSPLPTSNSSSIQRRNNTHFASSSFSLDGSIGSATINGPFRVGNSDFNTCSYHPLIEGESCRKPRTCYECLNSEVTDTHDGCLLAPSGFCESMSSFEASLDYRRNTTAEDLRLTGWYNFFPSVNATYCEPSDKACALCGKLANNVSLRQSFKWPNVSNEVERRFCFGVHGCVCVMACEAQNWEDNMPTECSANGSASGETNVSISATNHSTVLIIYLVLQVAVIAVLIYKRGHCQRLVSRLRPDAACNDNHALSSPSNQLRLSGWKKMQNTLIEREKNQRKDQHSQHRVSPRDDGASTAIEDRLARSMSHQSSTRDRDTARAAYTQVHDELETVRSCRTAVA